MIRTELRAAAGVHSLGVGLGFASTRRGSPMDEATCKLEVGPAFTHCRATVVG
jgi:hypothetical protein